MDMDGRVFGLDDGMSSTTPPGNGGQSKASFFPPVHTTKVRLNCNAFSH